MITKLDKLKWELYKLRRKIILCYGLKNNLIFPYENELIENLRHVYYGGVPASVLLLMDHYCQGQCYDRALLMTLGFGDDDFRLVYAYVDGISLQPRYVEDYKSIDTSKGSNHCFAERTKKDGTTWVYDTTYGLCYEKSLYYKIHRPKITKINDKQATVNYIEYQDIKNANIDHDKYIVPTILPIIEETIDKAYPWYQLQVKNEIEYFKKEINYDGLCREIEDEKRARRQSYKTLKNKPNN